MASLSSEVFVSADEVAVFRAALSPIEIQQLMHQGPRSLADSSRKALAAYYSFDEGNVIDSSGNEAHGEIVSGFSSANYLL